MRFRITFSLDEDDEGYDYAYTSNVKLSGGEELIDKLIDAMKYSVIENSYIDLKLKLKESKSNQSKGE
jgi:hypothetical protein